MRTIEEAIRSSNEDIEGLRRAHKLIKAFKKVDWLGDWFIHPGSVAFHPAFNEPDIVQQIIDYLELHGWGYLAWIAFDRGDYGLFWENADGLEFKLGNLPAIPAGYDDEDKEI